MDPPENTTVTIHEGGDVTLVCREPPKRSPTPVGPPWTTPTIELSESADELTSSNLLEATHYDSGSINQQESSPSADQTTGNDSASAATSTRSLVVSSHVLTLTSHFFKRMLATGMTEGNSIAQTGHVTIPLPDDDAEAMTVICNIIHHRNTSVQPKVDLSFLHDIAVLSDKCDFNEALKPTVTTWVCDYISDLGDDPNIIETASVRTPTGNTHRRDRAVAHQQWMQSRIDVWSEMLICAHFLKHHKLAQGPMRSLILGCHYPAMGMYNQKFEVPPKLLSKSRPDTRSDLCRVTN
jgi:hypothetical protein